MRLRSGRSKPEELLDPLLPVFDEYGFRAGADPNETLATLVADRDS